MAEVYRDGRIHVRSEQCANCLLSRDRLVPGERARQLIAETRATAGGSFICHRSQVSDEPEAICRAWWDRFAMEDPVLRMGVVMDIIEYVEVPDKSTGPQWKGPICVGCNGIGVARFTPAPPAEPYWHTCPACNGHGRDPS